MGLCSPLGLSCGGRGQGLYPPRFRSEPLACWSRHPPGTRLSTCQPAPPAATVTAALCAHVCARRLVLACCHGADTLEAHSEASGSDKHRATCRRAGHSSAFAQRNEDRCPHKDLCATGHSSCTRKSQTCSCCTPCTSHVRTTLQIITLARTHAAHLLPDSRRPGGRRQASSRGDASSRGERCWNHRTC